MHILTASQARITLNRIIEEVADTHKPVVITGKCNTAVLVSAEDWAAIQETMYLLSVPGLRESIREGMESPAEKCGKELPWRVGI